LAQQLAELAAWSKRSAKHPMGRGKNGKGRDEAFQRLRNGGK
jgi:hypothetical protein